MLRFREYFGLAIMLWPGLANPVPTDGPTVIATDPQQNELNVETIASIQVTFDADMNEATINNTTFTVNASYSGRHFGTFVYDGPGRTTTFTPDRPFQVSEIVTVVLTTGIESSSGFPLTKDYFWSFTIEVTQGYGMFDPFVEYTLTYMYYKMPAGDFDNDGDIDLAVNSADSLVILKNAGDATFVKHVIELPPATGGASIVADMNNDGFVDLVGSKPIIFLNTGDGLFTVDSVYDYGDLWNPCAADFDNDGDIDIAVNYLHQDSVLVFMNLGDGTLAPPVYYGTGPEPFYTVAADFDNDWDCDLAVTHNFMPSGEDDSTNVTVLSNNGDGVFIFDTVYGVGSGPFSACAADIEGDGDIDIFTANRDYADISALLNAGDGTFTEYPAYEDTHDWLSCITTVDLDADGRLDLLVGSFPATKPDVPTVYWFWNEGNGQFLNFVKYVIGGGRVWAFIFADLDGDGDIDLACNDHVGHKVSIHRNIEIPGNCGDINGDESINVADVVFLINYVFRGGPAPDPLCVIDANGDGGIDIGDGVFLLAYIFKGGPPPEEACCL